MLSKERCRARAGAYNAWKDLWYARKRRERLLRKGLSHWANNKLSRAFVAWEAMTEQARREKMRQKHEGHIPMMEELKLHLRFQVRRPQNVPSNVPSNVLSNADCSIECSIECSLECLSNVLWQIQRNDSLTVQLVEACTHCEVLERRHASLNAMSIEEMVYIEHVYRHAYRRRDAYRHMYMGLCTGMRVGMCIVLDPPQNVR